MKKILLLCILFPLFVHSQTAEHVKKFGIGVGYSLNTAIDNSIHPIELLIQYRATQNHSFYLDIPIYIVDKKEDCYDEEYSILVDGDGIDNLWGIGIGYTYSKPLYSNFYGFIGIGFEYQHCKDKEKIYKDFSENEFVSILEYRYSNKKDAYSVLPQLGLRYVLGPIEAELKYKLYISRIRDARYVYEERINDGGFQIPTHRRPIYHGNSIRNTVSFSISYFF